MAIRRRLTLGVAGVLVATPVRLAVLVLMVRDRLAQALFGVMPQLAGTCGLSGWGAGAGEAGAVDGGTIGKGCCDGGGTTTGTGAVTHGGVAETVFLTMPAGHDVAPWPSGMTTLPLAWDGSTEGALRPV